MALCYAPFNEPLVPGTLVRRYKRFLADVRLKDGTEVTAHCPNSGSMLGMRGPGSDVLLRHVADPKRRLAWTWEFVRPPGMGWIGCNTARPNEIVACLIETGLLRDHGLHADDGMRREVKYGKNSRIDILLGTEASGLSYVEVKNCTLRGDGAADAAPVARFPDAVTARGAKHMDELAAMTAAGHQATVVFLVNRADCTSFDVARDIDPTYGEAFDRAVEAGVRALPVAVAPGPDGWEWIGVLPLGHAAARSGRVPA